MQLGSLLRVELRVRLEIPSVRCTFAVHRRMPWGGVTSCCFTALSPHLASQSVPSIGVVETVSEASNLHDLIRLTAKRSGYSTQR